jgi:hypothetical protein
VRFLIILRISFIFTFSSFACPLLRCSLFMPDYADVPAGFSWIEQRVELVSFPVDTDLFEVLSADSNCVNSSKVSFMLSL